MGNCFGFGEKVWGKWVHDFNKSFRAQWILGIHTYQVELFCNVFSSILCSHKRSVLLSPTKRLLSAAFHEASFTSCYILAVFRIAVITKTSYTYLTRAALGTGILGSGALTDRCLLRLANRFQTEQTTSSFRCASISRLTLVTAGAFLGRTGAVRA